MTKIAGFGRKDIQVADPMLLCIVGGKGVLKGDERSEHDTDDGPSHPLWDGTRLAHPLSEEFIANVDFYGVRNAIEIVKFDDVICVQTGRRRVRAARVVNARRAKRGEPPISIDCVLKRPTSDASLIEGIINENEQRTGNEMLEKIQHLKRLIERGVSEEHAARNFGVSPSTIHSWLAFEDNATSDVKDAVAQGTVSLSAGAELARAKDPAKQREALAALATQRKTSTTAARRAVKKATKGADTVGITSRRTMKSLLDAVVAKSHKAGTSTATLGWWEGVEDVLKLILGEDAPEERLAKLLAEIEE